MIAVILLEDRCCRHLLVLCRMFRKVYSLQHPLLPKRKKLRGETTAEKLETYRWRFAFGIDDKVWNWT